MGTPENPSAISYAGNLLFRVIGIETFRQTRAEALAYGAGSLEASLFGLKDTIIKPIIPTVNRRDEDLILGLKVGTETYIGVGVPLYLALVVQNPAAAIGARIAYNFAVEIIPDAFRGVRRRFNPGLNSTLAI